MTTFPVEVIFTSDPHAPTTAAMELQLTDKEANTLQDMLQHYREFVEEVYNEVEDEESLFTETQRRLFTRFDVVSIRRMK
jgi:hypothetical protein